MLKWIFILLILCSCSSSLLEQKKSCVVVDTDTSFDDVRAIAWLLKKNRIDFIILTEGVTLQKNGALLLQKFFIDSDLPEKERPKFILGYGINKQINAYWEKVRLRDETLNGYYTRSELNNTSIEFGKLSDISDQCSNLQVHIIGPLTTANQYLEVLAPQSQIISFMGRLNKWDYNCWYDFPTCQKLLSIKKYNIKKVFIPDKDSLNQFYSYSQEDVKKLLNKGMAGTLKKAFLATPNSWMNGTQLMWDDLTVMIHYYPHWYSQEKDYWIPKKNAQEYKENLINTLNY